MSATSSLVVASRWHAAERTAAAERRCGRRADQRAPDDATKIAERCGVRLLKRPRCDTAAYSQWPEHCAFRA